MAIYKRRINMKFDRLSFHDLVVGGMLNPYMW